tara:strand:+ start:881 stop:2014 length:1134 start_codon:yes stop_codon:yes gene_type:complete
MNLEFTEEQVLLQDTLNRFLQNDYTFEQRQKLSQQGIGYSEQNWQTMAEMGLLGIPFEEEYGGFDFGATGLMIVMETIGKGLVVEPYLATVVLAGQLIQNASSEAQKQTLLPQLIEGNLKLAFAYVERQSRYDLSSVTVTAEKHASSFSLTGKKSVVFNAETADKIIVSARTSGNDGDKEGISLFLLDKDSTGITMRHYHTVDGLRASELSFEQVEIGLDALVGELDNAFPVIESVIDSASAAICAEGVGVISQLRERTVEYLKIRKQFSQPLGHFQVLQHRAVDMFMAEEQMRSLAYLASIRMEGGTRSEQIKAVSAAKVYLGEARTVVGEQAVQLHGGIGVTDELDVAHYYKRLTMLNNLFGDRDFHLQRFSQSE